MGKQHPKGGRRQNERRKQRPRPNRAAPTNRPPSSKARTRTPEQRRSFGSRAGILAGLLIVILAIAGIIAGVAHSFTNSATATATPVGFKGAGQSHATPAPTSVGHPTPTPNARQLAASRTVDGIQCGGSEQLAYHIHQHLTLYDRGQSVLVPAEIGIPGGEANAFCFYWIHVHVETPDIIHVESPIKKTFVLGDFFDIWKATQASTIPSGDAYLLALQEAAKRGQATTFYNGQRWTGSYRSIPLTPHAVITVEIGKPVVAPKPFTNWQGL